MKDQCIISLAYNKQIRIYLASSLSLVRRACKIHQTLPTASAALGRFLTVSAMMSLMHKDNEHLNLKIQGDGPIDHMLVEATNGVVRGYISNPDVYLVYQDGPNSGKLNVGAAVGKGFLFVTKGWNQKYYTSSSPLQTGEIGDDFTYYYATSEQTPSAVGLGVLVKNSKQVIASGGFIIQVLPNASDETITKLEEIIKNAPPISSLLNQGKSLVDILSIVSDNTHQILETHPIKYHCNCSKASYKKSLLTLNKEALEEILHEDKGAEIVCKFCKKKYYFTEDELQNLIDIKNRQSSTN